VIVQSGFRLHDRFVDELSRAVKGVVAAPIHSVLSGGNSR